MRNLLFVWLFAIATHLWLASAVPLAAAGRIVNFNAADGTPLVGTFYEAGSSATPCVVLVHMLGRQRDDWAGVAERLQQQGISALTIDLRGHGASGGTRTPLARMTDDVMAAVRWLGARSAVRADAIGIGGASLGASLALQAAAALPSVRSLALVSPSLDYRGVRIDAALVRKYGARPILFIASSEDPYALRSVRDLSSDTSGVREQRLASVAAHGTVLLNADPDLPSALVDWFRRTLIF
jgi:dienelactone hydrolase